MENCFIIFYLAEKLTINITLTLHNHFSLLYAAAMAGIVTNI